MLTYQEESNHYEINQKKLFYSNYRKSEIKVTIFKIYFIIHDFTGTYKFEINKTEVDTAIMIAKKIKSKQKENKQIDESKKINFTAAGTSFKQQELEDLLSDIIDFENLDEKYCGYTNKMIMDLCKENNKVFFEYEPLEIPYVDFVPEPTNEHDKNAIKIMAGVDEDPMYHIGYVPKLFLKEIIDIIDDVDYIDGKILGGKYKAMNDDGKIVTKKYDYKVDIVVKKN